MAFGRYLKIWKKLNYSSYFQNENTLPDLSQIFREQQNIISVVVVTTSFLFTVLVTTSHKHQSTDIDNDCWCRTITKLQLLKVTTGKSQSSKIDWSIVESNNFFCYLSLWDSDPPAVVEKHPTFLSGMIVLPHAKLWHPHVEVHNITVSFPSASNWSHPGRGGYPSIEHGFVVTNCKKGCAGFLPRAHFLHKKLQVARPLLQQVSLGGNEPNCKSGRATCLY